MKTLKKLGVALAAVPVLAIGGAMAVPSAHAATGSDVLDSRTSGLGDLFVLDRLFSDNSGILGNSGGHTNLGNLFILNQLFGRNGITSGTTSGGKIGGSNNLGDLFVLDRLFSQNSGILGNSGGHTNLGNLFILDQLFR